MSSTKASGSRALAETGLAPRGLSREQAAAYVGFSVNKFDDLVRDGRMPRPKKVDGRRVWDLRALDKAFSELPDETGTGGIAASANAGDEAGDVWSRARV